MSLELDKIYSGNCLKIINLGLARLLIVIDNHVDYLTNINYDIDSLRDYIYEETAKQVESGQIPQARLSGFGSTTGSTGSAQSSTTKNSSSQVVDQSLKNKPMNFIKPRKLNSKREKILRSPS